MNPPQFPPEKNQDALQPTEEEHPFIAPQLDDGGASRNRLIVWYATRFMLLFIIAGVLFGGSYGVYKAISGSSKKEQPVAVEISDNKAGTEQEVYQGDGSDITSTAGPIVDYVCPKEYTLQNVAEDEIPDCTGEKVSKTAATTSYSCRAGYNKNGSGETTKCSRYVGGATITRKANVKYTCAKGYAMSGTICKKKISTAASTVYSCPTGYTLSSTTCSKIVLSYGTVRSTCPTNFTKKGSGATATCQRIVARKSDGSCPANYTKVIINGKKKCRRIIAATLSCDSGYTKYGSGSSTTCRKYTVSTISATATKVCPSGYSLSSDKCYKTITKSRIKSYVCSSGYKLSGSTCYGTGAGRYESVPVKKTVTCKKGFSKASDGKHCEKRSNNTVPATPHYSCEDGWELLPGEAPVCVRPSTSEN